MTTTTTVPLTENIRAALAKYVQYASPQVDAYGYTAAQMRELATLAEGLAAILDVVEDEDRMDVPAALLEPHVDAMTEQRCDLLTVIGQEVTRRKLREAGDTRKGWGRSLDEDLAEYDRQIADNVAEANGLRDLLCAIHPDRIVL